MFDLTTLRRAYRISGDSADGLDALHLSEDRWERLACDELDPLEREAALDHILSCPLCSDTYRALQELRREAATFDPGVAVPAGGTPAPDSWRRRLWGGIGVLAAAAAVTLVVVLPGFRGERATDPERDVLRSAGTHSALTPVAPVEEGVSRRQKSPVVLRWRADDGPRLAVVEILDATGELLWTSRPTEDTEVSWPAADAPPGRYFWRVVAASSDGDAAASELVSFELLEREISASPP